MRKLSRSKRNNKFNVRSHESLSMTLLYQLESCDALDGFDLFEKRFRRDSQTGHVPH